MDKLNGELRSYITGADNYTEKFNKHGGEMDIPKILDGLKDKVLDVVNVELIKNAYELQEQNISQLKTNNEAIKETNELLKERLKDTEDKREQLEKELHHVKQQLKQQVVEDNEVIELSENATKMMMKIIKEDMTSFYEKHMVDTMGISKIAVDAALEELCENNLIEIFLCSPEYGAKYDLTSKAKKAISKQRIAGLNVDS